MRGPTFPPLNAHAQDSANVHCVPICGDNIAGDTTGETCDGTDAGTLGCSAASSGAPDACRTNCTCCGDGQLDAGEQCDDGNNTSHDGCSASCQIETCAVQVDKQVSCDGVNWFDAGLRTATKIARMPWKRRNPIRPPWIASACEGRRSHL
ncbi:MAG: DUF4215 domain-containing protein [Planctomycetes bacterium]|nr:DUF4215 domain-containing protein [Planctomycetota bacterium]